MVIVSQTRGGGTGLPAPDWLSRPIVVRREAHVGRAPQAYISPALLANSSAGGIPGATLRATNGATGASIAGFLEAYGFGVPVGGSGQLSEALASFIRDHDLEHGAGGRREPEAREPAAVALEIDDVAHVPRTALRTTSPVNFSEVQAARETATSKDGTKIPLTVLSTKGTKLDGKHPCEPYVFRSPDGDELCCIMRENRRSGTSINPTTVANPKNSIECLFSSPIPGSGT